MFSSELTEEKGRRGERTRLTRCQFHQRFSPTFFVRKSFLAAFSSYALALAKNLYEKRTCLTLMKLTDQFIWNETFFGQTHKSKISSLFDCRPCTTIDNWMNRPADQAFFVPLFWWLQVTLLTHLLLFSRGPFENLIPRVMSYQKRLAYLDATANSTRTDQKLSTQIQRLQVEQCYDYSYVPLFLLFLTNFEFFFHEVLY